MQKYPIISKEHVDATGRWKVGIFYKERGPRGNAEAIYPEDEAREVYLSCDTEYEAAMKFVTNWEHWKAVAEAPHAKKMIDAWREEKLMMDQTKARKMLLKAAEDGNLTAARVIYEAKKEEKANQEAKKQQEKVNQQEQELLNKTAARLVSIKAQTK
jgi:hypothetical protein